MLGAISAFLLVVLILVALMAIFDYSSSAQGQIELDAVGRYAGYCIFGAFGALFSVASRIDSIDFRLDIGRWEYFVGGLTRIGIGVIAGIVIGLVLNSKFVTLNFGLDDKGAFLPVVAYLLAFVAGFSESLVPNLLARGEEITMSSASTSPTEKPPAA
jgi:tetrahydromethanopterin S-methyltransferase subunit G